MTRYIFSILILVFLSAHGYASNLIRDAYIQNNQLVLKFYKPINEKDVKFFSLKGNSSVRYVFDFNDCIVKNSSMSKKLSYPSVKKFKISQFKHNIARVVLEVSSRYNIKRLGKSSKICRITLPHSAGYKKKTDSPMELFASLLPKKSSNKSRQNSKKKARIIKSNTIKRPKKRYTVVVDAGHGGKDSGALGGSRKYMEKSVVLKIAKRVRVHLKSLGFRVYMTRSNNRFVKLGRRTRYANHKHADAFVSIHANAAPKSRARKAEGIETYFLQISRSARSKRVAARENSVVLERKDRLSKNVILNLMTGPKIVMSNKMAIDVQKGMLTNLRKKFRGIKDNGVRPAPFWVLVGAQMPSVLVETGYITNRRDRQRLFSSRYQDLIAKGIAQGISTYFANREREME